MTVKHPKIFVVGATGAGKSAAAVEIARQLQRKEYSPFIINVDVTQFFECGVNIATNKVSPLDVRGIDGKPLPHAFLSFLDPVKDREYNIHRFITDVEHFVTETSESHPNAAFIFCGGTNYYLQSVLVRNELECEDDHTDEEDNSDLPPPVIPKTTTDEFPQSLWEQLNAVDQVSAKKYHPNDVRRIRRCLEIFNRTGIPPSKLREERKKPEIRFYPSCVIWIDTESREELNKKLGLRLEEMKKRGMVEEAIRFANIHRELVSNSASGRAPSCIFEAIGVKEFTARMKPSAGAEPPTFVIDAVDVENGMKESISNTIRYARQQQRWIRNRIVGKYCDLVSGGIFRLYVDSLHGTLGDVLQQLVTYITRNEQTGNIPGGVSKLAPPSTSTVGSGETGKCDICDKIICGVAQWEAHLKSKGHLGAIRHRNLVEEQRKLGREIPPKKRSR